MSKPLVSVIMAAFNVGNPSILDLAVLSIIQQDISDWELIICDDGSTDGTYEQLLRWENKDSRIHVLRNEYNQKAAAARNRCIELAQGEFVAIMDADDSCSTNRLRAQVTFLFAHPDYAFVGLWGERFIHTPKDTNNPYWFCTLPQPEDFLMTLPFVHASIMFRREALAAVGGYNKSSLVERSEDYDMLLRMYAKNLRGANISSATYYYRENECAFSRRKYRYRFKEAAIKLRGFAQLGLMPKGLIFALKPLIVGLIPVNLLAQLKARYYGQRTEQP